MLAATLPGGHLFQVKIDGVTGYAELTAPDGAIADRRPAVREPRRRRASKVANNAALGRKPKPAKTPAPKDTTVTVLNGNGVAGRGRERELPARPARLHHAAAARERAAERADPGLLPLADLLRPDPEEREGRGARAEEARRARRREAAAEGPAAARARPGRDAALRHGLDVPRHDRQAPTAETSRSSSRRTSRYDAASRGTTSSSSTAARCRSS